MPAPLTLPAGANFGISMFARGQSRSSEFLNDPIRVVLYVYGTTDLVGAARFETERIKSALGSGWRLESTGRNTNQDNIFDLGVFPTRALASDQTRYDAMMRERAGLIAALFAAAHHPPTSRITKADGVVDWAIRPLWQRLMDTNKSLSHHNLALAAPIFDAVRNARLPLLAPYFKGVIPVKDMDLFKAVHKTMAAGPALAILTAIKEPMGFDTPNTPSNTQILASVRGRDMLVVRQKSPTKPYASYEIKPSKPLRERLPDHQALRVFWR